MPEYSYKTQGTCSELITFRLEDGKIYDVHFTGGCNGNLQAIPRLVEGFPYQDIIDRIGGIRCRDKHTSCGDQLARAISLAVQAEQGKGKA